MGTPMKIFEAFLIFLCVLFGAITNLMPEWTYDDYQQLGKNGAIRKLLERAQ
jgi:hypothetical protein